MNNRNILLYLLPQKYNNRSEVKDWYDFCMFLNSINSVMKKNIFYIINVFFLALVLTGCNKKHDVAEATPEYIIGEWQLERITVSGVDYPVNDCMKRSRMYFSSNHDARDKYYTIYQSTGLCTLHLEHTGRWEFEDGKFYMIVETEGNTTLSNPRRIEIHFTDTEHAYVEQSYNGYFGTFYFKKLDDDDDD